MLDIPLEKAKNKKIYKYIVLFLFVCFCFWVVIWTGVTVQRPSRRLHSRRLFFYPLAGTEHGSQPSLTTRDRELVSVLEVRIEPGNLNPRPLTPQSATLPTLPRALATNNIIIFRQSLESLFYKVHHYVYIYTYI